MKAQCNQPECNRPHGAKGMCYMHYQRWRRGVLNQPLVQPRGVSLKERLYRHIDVKGSDDCWPFSGYLNKKGYGRIRIKIDGKWKYRPSHAVALELELGHPITGWGCHRCDNPPCCNPAHIYDGNAATNADDCVTRKRHTYQQPNFPKARGERHPLAKLTESAVIDIRRRYAAGGISQQALADEYGVNQTKISEVVRRRTWRHIP